MIQFYLRRFNDIDHTVPIIYRLAKDGYVNIEVLCLNHDFDIFNDIRLNFLRENYNIPIKYVLQAYTPTIFHRIVSSIILSSRIINSNANASRLKLFILKAFNKYLFRWIYRFLVKKILFNEKWARDMFTEKQVRLVVFDWQLPGKYIVNALKKSAKRMNIPIISVPHGISLYTNESWTVESSSKGQRIDFFKRNILDDIVIAQFERYKQSMIKGNIDADNIRVLGSARFCNEWRKIYYNLYLKEIKFRRNDLSKKLKVILMDHIPMYRIKSDVVYDSIKRITSLDFIDLIIKPSTATQEKKKGGLSSERLNELAFIDYNTSSIELIDWADVVMGTTSSILLEPLLMNKVFIYPKYFHENSMLWEEYEACWIVNNEDELEDALKKIYNAQGYKPYSDDNVNRFITEVVYNGNKDMDVLGGYEKFLLDCSGSKKWL